MKSILTTQKYHFCILALILTTFLLQSCLGYFKQPSSPFKNAESFESDKIPAAWDNAGKGKLQLSPKHYKHGKQSLKWTWQKGSTLSVIAPANIEKAGKSGGLRIWIYNEKPINGKLEFVFKDAAGKKQGSLKFNINYKGWRTLWAVLSQDIGYSGNTPIKSMQLVPPAGVSTGSIFFDIAEFATNLRSGFWNDRTPDYQFQHPGKKGKAVWDVYRWSLKKPAEPLPAEITDEQKKAFKAITKRYEQWMLGTGKYESAEAYKLRQQATQRYISNGLREFKNYNIVRHPDGHITGMGLFASRSPYLPNFHKNSLGQKVPLALALDYKVNGNQESKEKLILLLDYLHDQGWAQGSGVGTSNHIGNRLSSWVHSVFLLRNELKAAGKLQRELNTINWFTVFNETFNTTGHHVSTTADALRTKYMHRLLLVLAMEDSTRKVQYMRGLVSWLDLGLKITPGWGDTIKSDYLGYHHRGVYANAYSPNAYHMAAIVAYLLHGTEFGISDESCENLKQALLTQRIIMNKYDTPAALNGRIMKASTGNEMFPAYAYLAMCKEPVDAELAGAFMRLWQPQCKYLKDTFNQGGAGISCFYTLGDIELMLDFAKKPIKPEPAPVGFWSKPYGALAVHRRDDWMVSTKGWSRYNWNFEGRINQNAYGRYLSHGAMQILATGEPIDFISSGYNLNNGWDWNRWPAATTIHRPLTELNTNHQKYKRCFTDETFVGAVSLQGRNGLWAMQFSDPVVDKGFKANKTVFYFDNQVICLGSDIKNDNSRHNTETTVFQCYMKDENMPVIVNGRKVTDFPYGFEQDSGEKLWLTDPLGNGYIIPAAKGLHVSRSLQKSRDDRNRAATSGDYSTCWIDHGMAPAAGQYEYAILVQAKDADAVKTYAENPQYEVLQKDSKAHVVRHKGLKITGYAIFNSSQTFDYGYLRGVSSPVMVMVRDKGDGSIVLSLCDPDFRRPHINSIGDINEHNLFNPGRSKTVRAKLRGTWNIVNGPEQVEKMDKDNGDTVIQFDCFDAKTYEVKLTRSKV